MMKNASDFSLRNFWYNYYFLFSLLYFSLRNFWYNHYFLFSLLYLCENSLRNYFGEMRKQTKKKWRMFLQQIKFISPLYDLTHYFYVGHIFRFTVIVCSVNLQLNLLWYFERFSPFFSPLNPLFIWIFISLLSCVKLLCF